MKPLYERMALPSILYSMLSYALAPLKSLEKP